MTETTRQRLRPVLIASLALNMLLVGLLAALLLAGPDSGLLRLRHPPMGPLGAALNPHHLRQVLPDSALPVLNAALAAHDPGIRGQVHALMETRRELAKAIAAEPFDPDRVQEALDHLLTEEQAVAKGAQDMIVDLLERLGPKDRAIIAGLVQPPPRPGGDK